MGSFKSASETQENVLKRNTRQFRKRNWSWRISLSSEAVTKWCLHREQPIQQDREHSLQATTHVSEGRKQERSWYLLSNFRDPHLEMLHPIAIFIREGTDLKTTHEIQYSPCTCSLLSYVLGAALNQVRRPIDTGRSTNSRHVLAIHVLYTCQGDGTGAVL